MYLAICLIYFILRNRYDTLAAYTLLVQVTSPFDARCFLEGTYMTGAYCHV
jgi:hypothetical protein